uniref:Uncharacterized protein n=1 Tax=Anopheles merus TaxID=30066 RepID=A0A182V0G7_ANOME
MPKAGRWNRYDRLNVADLNLAPVLGDAGCVANTHYSHHSYRLGMSVDRVDLRPRGQLQRMAQVEITLVDEHSPEGGILAGHFEHYLLEQVLPLALLHLLDTNVVIDEQQLRNCDTLAVVSRESFSPWVVVVDVSDCDMLTLTSGARGVLAVSTSPSSSEELTNDNVTLLIVSDSSPAALRSRLSVLAVLFSAVVSPIVSPIWSRLLLRKLSKT